MISENLVTIITQLALAVFLGSLIGLERELKKKEAGLQTYSLVSLGSCVFTVIAFNLFYFFLDQANVSFDPSRIIHAVAVGIGFIGAGVIFRQNSGTVGLTTAAGLWVAASLGVAVGSGFYLLASVATVLTLAVLIGFGLIEKKVFNKASTDRD
jgi:putative Mg2+ transporter-C (MgtC) family protein